MKFSDVVMEWLGGLGYSHCFFVAGGNSMHLLDGARQRMKCVPFVHEVSAGVAAEYFNESYPETRAFVLVTAGPGLTNIVTAMAGAYLESRELLVLGGQVKSTDLARGQIRQRGIQEVDGVAAAAPFCVATARIEQPIPRPRFAELVLRGRRGRPGPVFIEVCLDAQAAPYQEATGDATEGPEPEAAPDVSEAASSIADLVNSAHRPILLIGGGVRRAAAAAALPALREAGIPVMTTWNGADRVGADEAFYFGRPHTWGQRYANVLLQQADLVVALGTRLGLMQTGFNYGQFVPAGRVVQVDIDPSELDKGHPHVDLPLVADANSVLPAVLAHRPFTDHSNWIAFCRTTKTLLPLSEKANITGSEYVSPYDFILQLSELCHDDDIVIPCSSGGAFTVTMQAFLQKYGQIIITNKGLASMGYGLAGAIGASLAHPERRTVLIEGDGGFAQNLQEVGTAAINHLPIKIFLLENDGYASIRMTQRNYFGGQYLGCDTRTGVGMPDWPALFSAYGIQSCSVGPGFQNDPGFRKLVDEPGPTAFIVRIDPEQTYFPKIDSRVTPSGGMESNPLHLMSPDLPKTLSDQVFLDQGTP